MGKARTIPNLVTYCHSTSVYHIPKVYAIYFNHRRKYVPQYNLQLHELMITKKAIQQKNRKSGRPKLTVRW